MEELQAEPTPTPAFPVQHSALPPEHAPTAALFRRGAPPTHEERLEHLRLKYPHRYARRHEPRREEWSGATPFPALDSWLFTGAMMISLLRSFLRLITFHTVLVTCLAVGSTLMCHYLDLTTDMPISLLASAIIFPISFGINYAFQRRERCFMTMASLKSSAVALYQCHREWDSEATWQEERRSREEMARQETDARGREPDYTVPQEGGEEHEGGHELVERKEDEDEPSGSDTRPSTIDRRQREERRMAAEVKEDIIRLFKEIKLYLTHKGGLESLFRIYTLFDELWVKQEDLRKRHEWVRSVISRPAQYHRYMMNDFENLKLIHDFRTASTLRGYGFVFLTIAPVLLGPYFAYFGDTYGLWAGVFISVFSSALLLTLYKIQEYVEDPFGGPDGINAAMMLEVGHHMF